MSSQCLCVDISDLIPEYEKVEKMMLRETAMSVASQTRNGISRCRPTMDRKNNKTKGN